MVWIQVIFFIITNAPTLIRSIRDLMEAFGGDKKAAKSVLEDMRAAQKQAPKNNKAKLEVLEGIIEKYKREAKARG